MPLAAIGLPVQDGGLLRIEELFWMCSSDYPVSPLT